MNILVGTVTGSLNARAKGGDKRARHLQVTIGSQDVRTVQQYSSPGEDSNPAPGSLVLILDGFALSAWDGLEPASEIGERALYSVSTDGKQRLGMLKLRKSGHAYLGNIPSGKNLKASLDALSDALVTFGTGLNPTTLPAQAAALVTAINSFKLDLSSFLDGAP